MCNSVAYIITTKYFWVPGKKRNKTNKCVWLLSIYCGFLFYFANLICLFAECFHFFYSFLAPHLKAVPKFSIWIGPQLGLSCLGMFLLVVVLTSWPVGWWWWVCAPWSCRLPQCRVQIFYKKWMFSCHVLSCVILICTWGESSGVEKMPALSSAAPGAETQPASSIRSLSAPHLTLKMRFSPKASHLLLAAGTETCWDMIRKHL